MNQRELKVELEEVIGQLHKITLLPDTSLFERNQQLRNLSYRLMSLSYVAKEDIPKQQEFLSNIHLGRWASIEG